MANWWDAAPLADPQQSDDSWWKSAPLAEGEPTTYDQYVAPVVKGVTDAAQGAYTAVVGKHDPKFKGLPSIEHAAGIMDPMAEMTGVSDAAYGDIMRKNLGDRFISSERDANGYEVVTFRGKDGQPQQAYINKPGLDGSDVNRAISVAVPYMLAASGVGRLARGAGTVTNMALQGLTSGAVSVGQDVAAQGQGSRQPVDTTRMLVSGGLGAGGELAGRVLAPFIRKMIRDQSLVGADGKLTRKGIELAKREGVDPVLIDKELAEAIQRGSVNALDPAEALVKAQTDRFGIPTTKGQRTNDPQMLLIEKDMRVGTLGPHAKEQVDNLDNSQKAAIERAARGESGGDAGTNVIAPRLAPHRSVQDQGGDVLGIDVKRGMDAAKSRINTLERNAWQATENIAPRSDAFATLPDFVQKALGSQRVDMPMRGSPQPSQTPAALVMSREIDAYIKGRAGINPEAPEVLGQQAIRYVDEMRRRLMAMKDGAKSPEDLKAAKAIYRAYDDWMVDAAEKNLLTGSPGAAQAVLNARRTTAELRGILQPRLNGKKTAAARILDKVGEAQTGEEVLRALLGASGPKASLPPGAVDAMKRFKAATTQLGGRAGKDAWNDVRLAHWLSLVVGKNGEMLPNGTLITSIRDSFTNRPSLMNALYSPNEQRLMRQFAQAIKSATPKDPNPPGSGTAVRGLFPKLVKDQLQAASTRATFGSKGQRHKILLARIYRGLSKVLPNILEGKNQFGSMAASRATSQSLTPLTPPSLAGYASAFSPSATTDRTPQFAAPRNSLAPRR